MTSKLTKKNLLQSSSFVLQLTLSITLLITTVLKNWCSLNIDETEAFPSHGYFDHGLNYYTCIRIWWRKHLQNYRDCCSECLSPSFVSAVIRIVFWWFDFFCYSSQHQSSRDMSALPTYPIRSTGSQSRRDSSSHSWWLVSKPLDQALPPAFLSLIFTLNVLSWEMKKIYKNIWYIKTT